MLETYIKDSWARLLRNSLDVALDPKVSGGMRSFLYIPPSEDPAAINMMISERRKITESLAPIEVKVLSDDFQITEDHGILYLPYNYIVPGGRFNEMYAWDSYWIIQGLLHDGYAAIAIGMVENFIYQVRHYGKSLNANRTYYLSRSQPPMLALMVMVVLPFVPEKAREDFMQRAADVIAHEYDAFWKTSRYESTYGLFHYGNYDQGVLGPCPEVTFGERDDHGLSHYDKVAAYLRELPLTDIVRQRFYDEANGTLTPDAFAGDRAMRESGFDASMQMGYYGLETIDYSPVCLNSLLYVQCQLLAHMYMELKQTDRARYFAEEADQLQTNIHTYMWDGATQMFRNFNLREKKPSAFPYLTCVYPMWAGIATQEQAQHFRDQLSFFETSFGIRGTDQQTGCQWDAPFMWAPLVYFATAGLQRYGFTDDAKRIAQEFIDTVRRVYDGAHANFEKYNAQTGGIRTEGLIEVGYSENVVGFGWTNGAVSILESWLKQSDIRQSQGFSPAMLVIKRRNC